MSRALVPGTTPRSPGIAFPGSRRPPGFSLLEILLAFVVLVVALIPLIELMTTTTKGTQLTRDYLLAYNIAQMAFEQVVNASTLDHLDSFQQAIDQFNELESQTAPNGCPGVPLTNLSTSPGDSLLPDDGEARFNFETGDPSFVSLFKRYSYSLKITPSSADTVVTTSAQATLARVDVKVHWKNFKRECQALRYSSYIVRRQF